MTDYLILRVDSLTEPTPTVKASSAKRALASADLPEGTYVAVPCRSWKPLTVKVEQTTKVTIG